MGKTENFPYLLKKGENLNPGRDENQEFSSKELIDPQIEKRIQLVHTFSQMAKTWIEPGKIAIQKRDYGNRWDIHIVRHPQEIHYSCSQNFQTTRFYGVVRNRFISGTWD